jgi:hypothetical protein
MILANLRAQLTATDLDLVMEVLAEGEPEQAHELRRRSEREGVDALLDDARLPERLRRAPGLDRPSIALFVYVIVRHALRDVGVEDVRLSDYLGALMLEFGRGGRAYRVAEHDDATYRYLTDLLEHTETAPGERRAFLVRAHLGNYSLWLAGLFPEYIAARRERNGGPGLEYYEALGALGFQLASDHRLAREFDLEQIYAEAATSFPRLRMALNRVADRHLFPHWTSPERLMRQVRDDFNLARE